jgi:hypothetical protein
MRSRLHLRAIVARFTCSFFGDYTLRECEADVHELIEERDALARERDLYRAELAAFVKEVDARTSSPWTFLERFRRVEAHGLALRRPELPGGLGKLDPAQGSPPAPDAASGLLEAGNGTSESAPTG